MGGLILGTFYGACITVGLVIVLEPETLWGGFVMGIGFGGLGGLIGTAAIRRST